VQVSSRVAVIFERILYLLTGFVYDENQSSVDK
jgi:hypothetical protein